LLDLAELESGERLEASHELLYSKPAAGAFLLQFLASGFNLRALPGGFPNRP
jgi:hypothetical protein